MSAGRGAGHTADGAVRGQGKTGRGLGLVWRWSGGDGVLVGGKGGRVWGPHGPGKSSPRGDQTPPGTHRARSRGCGGDGVGPAGHWTLQAFLGSLPSSLALPPYKGHCCTGTERNILSRHPSDLDLHSFGETPLKTIQVQDAKLLAPLSPALGRGSAQTHGPTSCQPPVGLK